MRLHAPLLACFLLLLSAVAGCDRRPQPVAGGGDGRQAPLFSDLGSHHHPVSTRVERAQRYFDQGLRLAFAFNHAEALRSFQEAARLDPACAICYWGQALVLGPNINAPMMPDAVPQAWNALQQAQKLAAAAPQTTAAERDYIQALAARYSDDPKADRAPLDRAYADAMQRLVQKYPDDLDAAALYAEALMDTTPWNYWKQNGRPREGTEAIIAALESVLERAPEHPLALHLYIHAIEASPNPERAEAAADRLGRLMPGAGHMVHMPAHIYLRLGRYHDASLANERAAAADESYFSQCGAQGFYPALYYPHNIHFLWLSSSYEGRSRLAIRSARKLNELVPPERAREYLVLEHLQPTTLYALLQFGRWEEALAQPAPPPDLKLATALHRYGRGTALANLGRMEDARAELEALRRGVAGEKWEQHALWLIPAGEMVAIAEGLLAAEIAGRSNRREEEIRLLREAVARQDALPYMEPPYWFYPLRQSLGRALLAAGRAAEAEAVYREDLRHNRRNGWTLFGLAQSLRAQGKTAAAAEVQRRFEQAWQKADVTLTASRL